MSLTIEAVIVLCKYDKNTVMLNLFLLLCLSYMASEFIVTNSVLCRCHMLKLGSHIVRQGHGESQTGSGGDPSPAVLHEQSRLTGPGSGRIHATPECYRVRCIVGGMDHHHPTMTSCIKRGR